MNLFKNILVLAIVFVVFGYGILFAIYNEQHIALDFLFLDKIQTPLSLWSGILITMGTIFGLAVATLSKFGTNRENKKLKKELQQAKSKLEKIQH
jgi:uncharacterized integral membrane protein